MSRRPNCRLTHDVLTWLQGQPQFSKTLVMVLTSSSEERDVNRCYELGARKFLVKPPNATMLTQLLISLKEFWKEHNEFTVAEDPGSDLTEERKR